MLTAKGPVFLVLTSHGAVLVFGPCLVQGSWEILGGYRDIGEFNKYPAITRLQDLYLQKN